MRIIEPKKYEKTRKSKIRLVLFVALLAITIFIFRSGKAEGPIIDTDPVISDVNTKPNIEPEQTITPGLRTFSGNEFRTLYDQLKQPNLDKIDLPPTITGNEIADTRIRQIAEARGYKIRSNPTVTLPSVDGFQLQEAVIQPWTNLKNSASKAGLTISLVSTYRSVDNQRSLFLSRLAAAGGSTEAIARGDQDDIVDSVLITSSIPGYSKHHTGYTFDIKCAGYAFENFKNSPCNTWLEADNYKVAKELGFIPSYPIGADAQGPDPEAWEYVWVGTDVLYTK